MSSKKTIKQKLHEHEIHDYAHEKVHKDFHKDINIHENKENIVHENKEKNQKHQYDLRHDNAQLNQSSGLTTGRIEALSDGVFSIAMTLLVLAFVMPANLSQTGLKQALIN